MARKKTKDIATDATLEDVGQLLSSNPSDAADQIDAILYFVHKRYVGTDVARDTPSLHTFLIYRADVVFTDKVSHVVLEKRPERNTLEILTPPVGPDKEEPCRIFLLNQFGDLLIRCQKQAYDQIREILLRILDAEGKEILLAEFLAFKYQQQGIQS